MDSIINQKAISILDQAGANIVDEYVNPTSEEEVLQMKNALAQAWEAAEDHDEPEFKEKYQRLTDVVNWSLSRHKTWKWPVIAGVALFAALLFWGGISNKDSIQLIKQNIKTVKAWEPCDTVIVWESCTYPASDAESIKEWENRLASANAWKAYYLREWKRRYDQDMESAAKYRQKAEAETDKEKKDSYTKEAKYWEDYSADYKDRFDELAPLKFEDVKKEALKGMKTALGNKRFSRVFFFFNFLLVLVLIGLYIWTGNPYGYEISKARTRHKILGWIRKGGFWLAGLCFGSGVAAQLFADDIVWKYSDGHTETESDVAGTAMNVMWKIILIVIGVVLFVAVSGIVMFFETAFALPGKIREVRS